MMNSYHRRQRQPSKRQRQQQAFRFEPDESYSTFWPERAAADEKPVDQDRSSLEMTTVKLNDDSHSCCDDDDDASCSSCASDDAIGMPTSLHRFLDKSGDYNSKRGRRRPSQSSISTSTTALAGESCTSSSTLGNRMASLVETSFPSLQLEEVDIPEPTIVVVQESFSDRMRRTFQAAFDGKRVAAALQSAFEAVGVDCDQLEQEGVR